MTIVASVKVRDGLVLGTDSMTQIHGKNAAGVDLVLKGYANARKLFQVRKFPIGVMTYGLGNIGDRSIESLMLEFNRAKAVAASVEQWATHLLAFFKGYYDAQFAGTPADKQPALGFYVAGYSKDQPLAEEWEFVIPTTAKPVAARTINQFGASWRGIGVPFTRIYKGYDPRVKERLKAKGMSDKDADEVLAGLDLAIVFDGMPVQDAVNFAVYVLETTIGCSGFEVGAAACGGDLQVAIILPDRKFEWLAHPEPAVHVRT